MNIPELVIWKVQIYTDYWKSTTVTNNRCRRLPEVLPIISHWEEGHEPPGGTCHPHITSGMVMSPQSGANSNHCKDQPSPLTPRPLNLTLFPAIDPSDSSDVEGKCENSPPDKGIWGVITYGLARRERVRTLPSERVTEIKATAVVGSVRFKGCPASSGLAQAAQEEGPRENPGKCRDSDVRRKEATNTAGKRCKSPWRCSALSRVT